MKVCSKLLRGEERGWRGGGEGGGEGERGWRGGGEGVERGEERGRRGGYFAEQIMLVQVFHVHFVLEFTMRLNEENSRVLNF